MIKVFQYNSAWGTPCISPYVTKVVNFLAMNGLEYELVQQDLSRLAEDAPRAKLPYIIDTDGTKICDSNEIIAYVKNKYGDTLDGDLSAEQKALIVAWNRLLDEHLYWSAVIQPRWRDDAGWETYIPYIVGSNDPLPLEERAGLDAFRAHILEEFNYQGMGGRNDGEVAAIARIDIDAIADYLGDKAWFLGDKPTSIDANVYSLLRHIIYVPFEWEVRDYAAGKANLVSYCERFRERYAI